MRDVHGRWGKGQSGNPRGRPRNGKTLSEALHKWMTEGRRKELLAALWEVAMGVWLEEQAKDGTRRVYREAPSVRALDLIFERMDGKAPQALEISTPDGLLVGRMTDEERREYIKRLAAAG